MNAIVAEAIRNAELKTGMSLQIIEQPKTKDEEPTTFIKSVLQEVKTKNWRMSVCTFCGKPIDLLKASYKSGEPACSINCGGELQ